MEDNNIFKLNQEEIEKNLDNIKKDTQSFINELKETVDEKLIDSIKSEKEEDNDNSDMEKSYMNVIIDPNTGEHKILGYVEEDPITKFNDLVDKINEGDTDILSTKPFTEDELINLISSKDDDTIVSEVAPGMNISAESIRTLLDIINRRINKENFDIYKALPDEIKISVDNYIRSGGELLTKIPNINSLNSARNYVAQDIIDSFIYDIRSNRSKNDFAREMEYIYSNRVSEINTDEFEYIEDRNKAFRKLANEIEDEGKKARFNLILDQIDEARNLTKMKEFSKKCKIKKIEFEKPATRVYNSFLNKYVDSTNNIYDINIAYTVLCRIMSSYECTEKDIHALLICFCKQVKSYNVDNVGDHTYMYYFLYYCVMLDNDKSTVFKDNIYEVIKNLRELNKY